METKLQASEYELLRVRLDFDDGFMVSRRGREGFHMVLWKNELNVSIRSFNIWHIDMVVGIPD